MTDLPVTDLDAIVVGSNIRGLVTAHTLNSFGVKTLLLDRSPVVGGVDGSFVTPGDTRFEYGMHVLDYERSLIATRLFTKVTQGEVHKIKLKRAILLRNQIMPYAPTLQEMPEEFRAMLPPEGVRDDIKSARPSRERIEECYGKAYSDFIFDEVLPSFPTENRHREFGVDPAQLLDNIYPWFFPRAERNPENPSESRAFHDKLREGIEQHIIYPKEGGFGGFANGFVESLEGGSVELMLGVEAKFELDAERHRVEWIEAGGRRFRAPHVFWCASWPALCGLTGIPCQDIATDRVLIGSFKLNKPANTDFMEILIGDPSHRIARVYFPARFRKTDEPLMQLEFAYPKAEDRPEDPEAWREIWVSDLKRMGLLDDEHEIVEFDFKSVVMHFNAYGMEGEELVDADPSLLHPESNLRPVVPSMRNLNLNGHVPRTVRYVTDLISPPV